jgi:hypothetical protein
MKIRLTISGPVFLKSNSRESVRCEADFESYCSIMVFTITLSSLRPRPPYTWRYGYIKYVEPVFVRHSGTFKGVHRLNLVTLQSRIR